MRKKAFDCVEMMHAGAAKVRAETRGMSMDQQVAYWRKRTDVLRRVQRGARRRQAVKQT
jgi:hypothetical protein